MRDPKYIKETLNQYIIYVKCNQKNSGQFKRIVCIIFRMLHFKNEMD